MKIIAHRANLQGPNPSMENKKTSIEKAIKLGFDVEIDVWGIDNEYFLGHDFPQEKVTLDFLSSNSTYLWIHTKNLQALESLKCYPNLNCFWHDKDKYTLTSMNFIWAYPGVRTTKNVVTVHCELNNIDTLLKNNFYYGICTDWPIELSRKLYKK